MQTDSCLSYLQSDSLGVTAEYSLLSFSDSDSDCGSFSDPRSSELTKVMFPVVSG